MKCGTTTCVNPIALVEWPGQPTMLCLSCVHRAQRVADIMGFVLAIESVGDPLGRFDGAERLPLVVAMGLSVMSFVWTFVDVKNEHVLVSWRRPRAPRMVTEYLGSLGFNPLREGSTLFERYL